MAYIPQTWQARTGSGLNRFVDQHGNVLELTASPTEIITPGTPFTADRMTHIEEGIEEVAEAIENMRSPAVFTATLTAAGWSNRQQVISNAAIYSATAPGDVKIALSASDEQFAAWNSAAPRNVNQAVGSITLRLKGDADVPTVDIPIIVEVR